MQAYSKRLNRYKKKVNNKHPKSVRADVGLFFHNLLIEGLAKYLQYHSSDIFKNKRNLYVLYGEAADKAHKINIFISLFMEQKKEGKVKKRLIKDLRKELYYSKYLIGEYMCERIVASGGEKTETLIKTKPLAFIRKYEAAEKKLGFTPVVSLNSKKGILDYNHALAKLAALSR